MTVLSRCATVVVPQHLVSSRPVHRRTRGEGEGTEKKKEQRTGEQHRVIELLADRRLNLRVRREVDTAGRLVEHDDRAPAEQRARHRDQLPLSLREVRAPRRDLRVERDDRPAFSFGRRCRDGRDRCGAPVLSLFLSLSLACGGAFTLSLVNRRRAGGHAGRFARGALRDSLTVGQQVHTLEDVYAFCVRVFVCRAIGVRINPDITLRSRAY